MTLVSAIQTSIALHIRDTGNDEVTSARLLTLINDAVQDASNSGWWIPDDDEAITTVAGANVIVPTGMAYIKEILDDTAGDRLEQHWWKVEIVGGDAEIVVFAGATPVGASKIYGWKRPTVYTGGGDTVDPGLESFLRERATAYALKYMAAGQSELDRSRIQMSELAMRDSEAFLSRQPQQYKIMPRARYVPGR